MAICCQGIGHAWMHLGCYRPADDDRQSSTPVAGLRDSTAEGRGGTALHSIVPDIDTLKPTLLIGLSVASRKNLLLAIGDAATTSVAVTLAASNPPMASAAPGTRAPPSSNDAPEDGWSIAADYNINAAGKACQHCHKCIRQVQRTEGLHVGTEDDIIR